MRAVAIDRCGGRGVLDIEERRSLGKLVPARD